MLLFFYLLHPLVKKCSNSPTTLSFQFVRARGPTRFHWEECFKKSSTRLTTPRPFSGENHEISTNLALDNNMSSPITLYGRLANHNKYSKGRLRKPVPKFWRLKWSSFAKSSLRKAKHQKRTSLYHHPFI